MVHSSTSPGIRKSLCHDNGILSFAEGKDNSSQTTVLVVDDSPIDQRLAGGIVANQLGWKVIYAANGIEALAVMEKGEPHVVVTDLLMPEMDGLELVQAIRGKHPTVPVILMTAHGSEDIAIQAIQKGAASYVPKKSLGAIFARRLNKSGGRRGQAHPSSACSKA